MSTMQGQRDAGTEEVLREWVWQHGIQTGVNGSKANRETVQAVTQHTARGVEHLCRRTRRMLTGASCCQSRARLCSALIAWCGVKWQGCTRELQGRGQNRTSPISITLSKSTFILLWMAT